jgi:hypothetical protein
MKTEQITITKEMVEDPQKLAETLNTNLETLNSSIEKTGDFILAEFKDLRGNYLQKLLVHSNNIGLDTTAAKKSLATLKKELKDFREETDSKLNQILELLRKK